MSGKTSVVMRRRTEKKTGRDGKPTSVSRLADKPKALIMVPTVREMRLAEKQSES